MGTSTDYRGATKDLRDHPHAYGDKDTAFRQGRKYKGSSPRVWGQAYGYVSDAEYTGIIPTRMGTSRPRVRA